MGNIQSYDPAHVRIYQNVLKIQNPVTRSNMIETLLSAPEYVAVAKQAGIYSEMIKYVFAVRNGHLDERLPGESAPPAPAPAQKGLIGTITSYADKINPWRQVSKKPQEKVLSYFNACLDVLALDEKQVLTEEILKSAYKKASVKAHPDKGGSEEKFQTVARAYAYLSEILKRIRGEGTRDDGPPLLLEKNSNMSAAQAPAAPESAAAPEDRWKNIAPVHLNPKNLNMDTFNRVFEQTRMSDPESEGYSNWLKDDSVAAGQAPKMSGKFNADNFNRTFADYVGNSTADDTDIHPASMALTMAPDMGVELASEGRRDFTAPANADLQYTDLKRAYTTDAVFTNKVANVVVENRDMKRYQAERDKAPVLSAHERQRIDAEEAKMRQLEASRAARIDEQRRQEELYFERMKGLIITDNGRQ